MAEDAYQQFSQLSKNADTDFDLIATNFEEGVYGSSNGYIRFNVLIEDLETEIPPLARGGLSVLDVGGGTGHLAIWMAQHGNHIVLGDPSQEMLKRARAAVDEADLSNRISLMQATIQDLDKKLNRKFDVITCHAVLEWLAEPKVVLSLLANFIKPEGLLSLMFYNSNAAIFKRVLRGEFVASAEETKDTYLAGWESEARPLAEEVVRDWVTEIGLRVRSKSGIRIFHDYLNDAAKQGDWLNELLTVEKSMRKREPFASLAQHIHLVCERKS